MKHPRVAVSSLIVAVILVSRPVFADALTDCTHEFSVCHPPDHWLGYALIAVPILGAMAMAAGLLGILRAGVRFPERRALAGVLAAAVATAVLSGAIARPAPAVYYDEFLHSETTENLFARFSPHPCCRYSGGSCFAGGPIMWPLSTHLAATIFMPFVSSDADYGRGFAARSLMNRTAAVVTTVLIAVWAYAMSSSSAVGVVAAWCWVFVPGAVKASASADLAPVTLVSILVLLIATELLRRRANWSTFALVVGAVLFVSHTRLEAGLAAVWSVWRVRDTRIGTRALPAVIGLLVVAVLAIVPLYALYRNGLAASVSGWALRREEITHRLPDQLSVNAAYLINRHAGSPLQVAFALAALATRRGREMIGAAILALAFFALYAVYPLGRFESAGVMDGWRYALPIQLLCIPLAASAIVSVASHLPLRARPIVPTVVLVTLAVMFMDSRPFLYARHPAEGLDRSAIARRSAQRASPAALIVTRSVAFSRILMRTDVEERCTAIADPGFAAQVRGGDVEYLRAMGDREPPTIGDAIPVPVAPRLGVPPWLYRYQLGQSAPRP